MKEENEKDEGIVKEDKENEEGDEKIDGNGEEKVDILYEDIDEIDSEEGFFVLLSIICCFYDW